MFLSRRVGAGEGAVVIPELQRWDPGILQRNLGEGGGGSLISFALDNTPVRRLFHPERRPFVLTTAFLRSNRVRRSQPCSRRVALSGSFTQYFQKTGCEAAIATMQGQ